MSFALGADRQTLVHSAGGVRGGEKRHHFGGKGRSQWSQLETHWRGSVSTLHHLLNLFRRLASDFLKGSTDPGESICRAVVAVASSHSNPRSSARTRASAASRIASASRRAEYHRRKIETDPVYAEVVNDSRKKWRDAHPDYQKTYRQSHEAAVERNRQLQRQRDGKRRVQSLVKNNLALDLKRSHRRGLADRAGSRGS